MRLQYYFASFLVAVLLFCVTRFPFIVHQAGGSDEGYFAVPGMTMWREGVPRIPYFHTKERASFLAHSDKVVAALPPGLHYIQAPFFAFLSPSLFTARLPVFLLGIVLIGLVGVLGYQLRLPFAITSSSMVLIALSRPLMFCATVTRPDLPCAICGLLAICFVYRWLGDGKARTLLIAGLLNGLGFVFHPFAVVCFVQIVAMVVIFAPSMTARCKSVVLYGVGVFFGSLMWICFVAMYPQAFLDQFVSNVLERSGPGLPSRILWPFPTLFHQLKLIWRLNEPFQFGFLSIGLLVGVAASLRQSQNKLLRTHAMIVVTAGVINAIVVGIHYTKGYWLYPISLAFPLAVLGWFWMIRYLYSTLISPLFVWNWEQSNQSEPQEKGAFTIPLVMILLGIIAMLPQGGFSLSYSYLTHWREERLDARKFVKSVLDSLPQDAKLCVDETYVFEIYLAGKDVAFCSHKRDYDEANRPQFDYLLLGRVGNDYHWNDDHDAQFLRRIGDDTRPENCFVDIYIPNRD